MLQRCNKRSETLPRNADLRGAIYGAINDPRDCRNLRGEWGLHIVRLTRELERVQSRVAVALEPQELNDLQQLRRDHRYAKLEQSVAETDGSEKSTRFRARQGRCVGITHRVAGHVWDARCVRRHGSATRWRHCVVVEFPIVHLFDDLVSMFVDLPRLAQDPAPFLRRRIYLVTHTKNIYNSDGDNTEMINKQCNAGYPLETLWGYISRTTGLLLANVNTI